MYPSVNPNTIETLTQTFMVMMSIIIMMFDILKQKNHSEIRLLLILDLKFISFLVIYLHFVADVNIIVVWSFFL